jgi:16S rRNA G527 N7-methylase RsmG
MRQALDLVQISGKDAKFLASLQIKLENEYAQIQAIKAEEEAKKQAELQVIKTKEKK